MGLSRLDLAIQKAGSIEALVDQFGPESVVKALASWEWIARPEQLIPDGDWDTWFIQAGRFWGKTRTGAQATDQVARQAAQWIRDGIIRLKMSRHCIFDDKPTFAVCAPMPILLNMYRLRWCF